MGVLPANDGRGYILRRLIRRAARYGKLLGRNTPFLHELVPTIMAIYKDIYPELLPTALHVMNALKAEETAFFKTFKRRRAKTAKPYQNNPAAISGEEAF